MKQETDNPYRNIQIQSEMSIQTYQQPQTQQSLQNYNPTNQFPQPQQTPDNRNPLEIQVEELKRKNKQIQRENDNLISIQEQQIIDHETLQIKYQSLMEEKKIIQKCKQKKRDYKQRFTQMEQRVKELETQNQNQSRVIVPQQPMPIENSRLQELGNSLNEFKQQFRQLIFDKNNLEQQVQLIRTQSQTLNETEQQYRTECFVQLQKNQELTDEITQLKSKMEKQNENVKSKEDWNKIVLEKEKLLKENAYFQTQNQQLQQKVLETNPTRNVTEYINDIKRQNQEFFEEQNRQELLKVKQEQIIQKEIEIHAIHVRNDQEKIRKQTAKEIMKKMKESHGVLELCFVVDTTGSMDPYKEQTIKCIEKTRRSIKEKTNRDAICSAVCYKDLCDKKRPDSLYNQQNFTENSQEFEKFLKGITCQGGGDFCEDIGGGLKQMSILICDSPGHGHRFNGGCTDDHPDRNADLEQALKLIIDKEIILIGLNFTKYTKIMYSEFVKIFQEHGRSELFMAQDLSSVTQGNIWKEMADLISQASVVATKTNNSGTQSRKHLQAKNKDSAIEALCKSGNFYDFDKQDDVKKVDCSFEVYTVNLSDAIFKNNYQNIQELKNGNHYQTTLQGTWKCIRTEHPFAFGMMKQVFLMKKQAALQNELYVIKTPLSGKTYKSEQEAIKECRSHLISQSFMKMYSKDIQNACSKKFQPNIYPKNVVYSEILILKESSNSYWLAERFFKGDFVKYNNNYGFINDEQDTPIHQFALGFSYYTFYKSSFNYAILDVQGVGNYFTDPAINTQKGNFDETDMGHDGISRFMVVFDMKKKLCNGILKDLLNIDTDAN